ncbi:Ionotropic receptor 401 [Blattella germanica]|nr:Ionotropic receptor 401 [Blattella germanica]
MNALGCLLTLSCFLWGADSALPPRAMEELSECVLNISRTYFDPKFPVVVQTPDMWHNKYKLSYPLVRAEKMFAEHFAQLTVGYIEQRPEMSSNTVKPGSYVFFIPRCSPTTVILLSNMFTRILQDARNPAAKVIVAFIEAFDEEFTRDMTALHYLVLHVGFSRVVFVIPTKEQNAIIVISFPLSGQANICLYKISHMELEDIWIVHERKFFRGSALFKTEKKLNFEKCILNIYVVIQFPFIYTYQGVFAGSGFKALQEFCQLYNCSLSFQRKLHGNVHASFPVIYGEGIIFDGSEMSYPQFQCEVLWFVPSGMELPRWQCMFKVFDPLMSSLVLVTAASASLTLWLFKKSGDAYGHSVLLTVLLTHLGVGDNSSYKGPLAVSFFALWLFYCLLINTAYQSGLFELFVSPGREPPIETLQQLEHSGLEMKRFGGFLGVDRLTYAIFKYNNCAGHNDLLCFREVAESRTTAVLADGYFGAIRSEMYVDRFGNKKILRLAEAFATLHLSFYFTELSHILQDAMDRLLGRFTETGIINKWNQDQIRNLQFQHSIDIITVDKVFAFSLNHLQGGFYILLIGSVLSCLLFAVEILLTIAIHRHLD